MHSYAHAAQTIVVVRDRLTYTFHAILLDSKEGREGDAIFVDRTLPGNMQFVFPVSSVNTRDKLGLKMFGKATEEHIDAAWEALEGLSR